MTNHQYDSAGDLVSREAALAMHDNWIAVFGEKEIRHTSAREYALDTVLDLRDAIRALPAAGQDKAEVERLSAENNNQQAMLIELSAERDALRAQDGEAALRARIEELERESDYLLQRLHAVEAKAQDIYIGIDAERNALHAQVEAMRKDKAYLDFLDECNTRLNAHYGTTYGWKMVMNYNVNRLMTGRHLDVDLNDAEARGHKSCRGAIETEMRRIGLARAALPNADKGEV